MVLENKLLNMTKTDEGKSACEEEFMKVCKYMKPTCISDLTYMVCIHVDFGETYIADLPCMCIQQSNSTCMKHSTVFIFQWSGE